MSNVSHDDLSSITNVVTLLNSVGMSLPPECTYLIDIMNLHIKYEVSKNVRRVFIALMYT